MFGSLKTSTTIKSATNKRQILTSQMREKAFGRLGEAATTTTSAAPSQMNSLQQQPIVDEVQNPIVSMSNHFKPSTPPPAAVRSPVLSPLDTYDMSDHEGSSDTDEEEERVRRAGKTVPKWAQREKLKQALHYQYNNNTIDPDDLFGEVTTCDLEMIFDRKKAKYSRRTSSGNWTRDKATVAEKIAFKRTMGYTVKA